MPIFTPTNMQGGGNTVSVAVLSGVTAILLEWGHFIDNADNLLFLQGEVALTMGTVAGNITLNVLLDGTSVDTQTITSIAAGESVNGSVGVRLTDLTVGHHVFQLAASGTDPFSASNKEVMSLSGDAVPGT
ncbi:hypothetical protein KZ483_18465 [Paenibacillus sp. sptzw28]|uniref:hypothetical protein n=1 Tax=Paenibacillus sp. sptzw28 TaxID=715179 RepID=UPI001C6E605F|nr:hypothetical protein [Paenibacillus sp. sptzw28]QYR19850.1 hypothetical protein KZ483_18465 [Paenibacillus sp. sptzw28]